MKRAAMGNLVYTGKIGWTVLLKESLAHNFMIDFLFTVHVMSFHR